MAARKRRRSRKVPLAGKRNKVIAMLAMGFKYDPNTGEKLNKSVLFNPPKGWKP